MRPLLVMCLGVMASIALRAQQPAAPATPRQRDVGVEVIGCVDGSTLTETDQVDTTRRGRAYVGTAADRLDEPALVNPPTLRVASFSPTNNRCQ